MPVKKEEALSYFGYTDTELEAFENIDALKADAESKYIRKEHFIDVAVKDPNVTGKILGSLQTKLKSTSKTYGIELTADELKEPTPEKIHELTLKKLSDAHNAAMTAAKATGGDTGKLKTEYEQKVQSAYKERDDYKEALEKVQGEFKNYQDNIAQTESKRQENSEWEAAVSKIKFSSSKDQYTKKGWLDTQRELYRLEKTDTGKFVPVDKEGHRIKNPKIAGGLYDNLADILVEAATKDNMIEINPHSKEIKKPILTFTQNNNGEEKKPLRKIGLHTPNFRVAK